MKSTKCIRQDAAAFPSTWATTTLGNVTFPRGVKVKPSEMKDAPFIGLKDIEAHTLRLLGTGQARNFKSSGSYFDRGDVLYGRLRPYLNKVYQPDFNGIASGEFIVFPNQSHLNNTYLMYFLNQLEFVSYATRLNAGDRPRVDFDQLANYPFPLPPLAEQRRIVAEIEKQFTRLDAAEAALRRVEVNSKRYRASVLKAACEGELVPTEAELAEAEGRDYEHAEQLLARILAERRALWESQGKKPKKYQEPGTPDVSSLPQLPEGWAYATAEQMIIRSEYGTSAKCNYEADGVPVLRIPNIVAGKISLADVKYATQPVPMSPQNGLQVGDVLMCRTNGSVSLVGKTAVVQTEFDVFHSFASYLLRFRFAETQVLPRWFHAFVDSQLGRSIIELNAASSAGQHNVNLKLIHGMTIPLPPFAEQCRILTEVERQLSVVQQTEGAIQASLKRVGRLRQSILKLAFCGQLVPQDPDDEPASILLERADEEVAAPTQRKTRRRRSKSASDRQLPLLESEP